MLVLAIADIPQNLLCGLPQGSMLLLGPIIHSIISFYFFTEDTLPPLLLLQAHQQQPIDYPVVMPECSNSNLLGHIFN